MPLFTSSKATHQREKFALKKKSIYINQRHSSTLTKQHRSERHGQKQSADCGGKWVLRKEVGEGKFGRGS